MTRSTIALVAAALLVTAPAAAQDTNEANMAVATNEVSTTDLNAMEPVVPANDMTMAVPPATPQSEPAAAPARAPRGSGFPWGLLGLVGLVGLLGRMRR